THIPNISVVEIRIVHHSQLGVIALKSDLIDDAVWFPPDKKVASTFVKSSESVHRDCQIFFNSI
ncbi:unnamed protein product, partial [Hymenolepis diminuta]